MNPYTEEKLALFPLNTVLFPGAALRLHIFEERYRLMIGHCLDRGHPFGVILMEYSGDDEQGDETLVPPSLPHRHGTVAHIHANLPLDDGRILIATIGLQRFVIRQVLQYHPYLVAAVTMLPEDEDDESMRKEAQQLRQVYAQYWKSIAMATGSAWQGNEKLPDHPVALTYYLAHRMQVTNERKQHWLETDSLTRVREITAMLQSELRLLPHAPKSLRKASMHWPWSWN